MRSLVILLAICVSDVAVGATVISDTHISLLFSTGDPQANTSLGVHQGVVGGNLTGGNFQFSPFSLTEYTLTPKSIVLDEGADWYLVEPGDAFTKQGISSGKFTPVMSVSNGWNTVTVGPDFYLGVNTGGLPPDSRESFGWLHLRVVNDALTMVENVMAYDSPGIIVGTTSIVPEPAAFAMTALGLGSLAALRRRK